MLKLCISLLGLGLLSGCGPKADDPAIDFSASDEAIIRESQQLVQSLKTELSSELKAALQSGGIPAAIEVCQRMATPITEGITAEEDLVQISRTALRFRNPANAPSADSREILEEWTAYVTATGQTPKPAVARTDRTLIVHYPIRLQANCLACHGDPDSFQPEVTEALKNFYPNDAAVGFAEGDLRGAFRVEYRR
jgi:hypothetical protein